MRRFRAQDGAQIVELAVTLPLLVVLFVGTYDFGHAFNLRQKLVMAAREGTRLASNQPTADLSQTVPPSILAVRDVVDNYLTSNNVNDCGLSSMNSPSQPANWTWQFQATGCPAGTLTLQINRGQTYSVLTSAGNTVTVEATQITLMYPYQWQFGRVVQLIIPGASYGAGQISIDALMQNLN